MDNDASHFLEQSFLAPLLALPEVTDISFNGAELYYVSNASGRKKAETHPTVAEVGDFLRQIANLCEKQFSYCSPILDVSFGRYRLNGVFPSLARKANWKTYSFSLRIASPCCAIEENPLFFEGGSKELLLTLLNQGESLVIGGVTSSGKTELEKWCLLHLRKNTRVIVIDNVEELDLLQNPELDLTTWLVNEKVPDASFGALIKNALRNNPDYIIVAEARGKEMLEALLSAMSGHPVIISIHAQDLEGMPERVVRLALLANERLYHDEIRSDLNHHIRYYAYCAKAEQPDGSLTRYLESVGEMDERTGEMKLLYRRGKA